MTWATFPASSSISAEGSEGLKTAAHVPHFAVQLVRQINYGPLESIRYFIPMAGEVAFAEVSEADMLAANFQKVNSYVIDWLEISGAH
jgi:hypothetical protein